VYGQVEGLKWVLAHPHQDAASKSPHTSRGTVLRSLSEIFPVSEFDFVWAVESTLHTELDVPVPAFLKASRSVKSEPTVLVSQLEACARAASLDEVYGCPTQIHFSLFAEVGLVTLSRAHELFLQKCPPIHPDLLLTCRCQSMLDYSTCNQPV